MFKKGKNCLAWYQPTTTKCRLA